MEAEKVKITIKTSQAGNSFDIEVAKDITVQDLKEQLSGQAGIPAAQQRLVYKGKILNDSDTLSALGVENSHSMHLVKKAGGATAPPTSASSAPAPSSQPAPPQSQPSAPTGVPDLSSLLAGLGGMGGMGGSSGATGAQPGMFGGMDPSAMLSNPMYAQMMQNPMYQQMMQQMMSNPAMLEMIINSNPQTRQMIDNMPGAREMLSNPAMMQQISQMMGGMGGLGGLGRSGFGGFGSPSATTASPSQPSTGASTSPSASPAFGAFPGMGMFGVPPVTNPQEAYRSQIQQLKDMGFVNESANIQALQATGGNVEAAVERLLNMLG
mmetsp:Transcript_6841/g.12389  ORF Transcript_6841/g.12389 Transcript_6841/m.12389 type:complete len:323 (-) Transcript_6841:1344-2312(-)